MCVCVCVCALSYHHTVSPMIKQNSKKNYEKLIFFLSKNFQDFVCRIFFYNQNRFIKYSLFQNSKPLKLCFLKLKFVEIYKQKVVLLDCHIFIFFNLKYTFSHVFMHCANRKFNATNTKYVFQFLNLQELIGTLTKYQLTCQLIQQPSRLAL